MCSSSYAPCFLAMAPKRRKTVQPSSSTSNPRLPREGKGNARQLPNLRTLVFPALRNQTRYDSHVFRKLLPTRYAEGDVMNTMGIRDDIYFLFWRMGIDGFLDFKYPTYQRLTLEFLVHWIYSHLRRKVRLPFDCSTKNIK